MSYSNGMLSESTSQGGKDGKDGLPGVGFKLTSAGDFDLQVVGIWGSWDSLKSTKNTLPTNLTNSKKLSLPFSRKLKLVSAVKFNAGIISEPILAADKLFEFVVNWGQK